MKALSAKALQDLDTKQLHPFTNRDEMHSNSSRAKAKLRDICEHARQQSGNSDSHRGRHHLGHPRDLIALTAFDHHHTEMDPCFEMVKKGLDRLWDWR